MRAVRMRTFGEPGIVSSLQTFPNLLHRPPARC